jgi:hypothetical protein
MALGGDRAIGGDRDDRDFWLQSQETVARESLVAVVIGGRSVRRRELWRRTSYQTHVQYWIRNARVRQ